MNNAAYVDVVTRYVHTATAVLLGLWLLQLAWRAYWARGLKPVPVRPTGEFGDLTPAVVHLITTGREMSPPDAAAATVVDLAARRFVGIELIGGNRSLIRLRNHDGPLRPYEQQILEHLRRVADPDGTLPTDQPAKGVDDGEKWWAAFNDGVVAEARQLKLTRKVRGWGSGVSVSGMFGFLLLGLSIDMTVFPWHDGLPTGSLITLGLFTGFFMMTAFDRKFRGERLTRRGRSAAGQWLTEREHLKGIANLNQLPAAAVTIWERPFAYASALSLTDAARTSLSGTVPTPPFGSKQSDYRTGWVFLLIWSTISAGVSIWYATHDFRFRDIPPFGVSLAMIIGGGLVMLVVILVVVMPVALLVDRIRR